MIPVALGAGNSNKQLQVEKKRAGRGKCSP